MFKYYCIAIAFLALASPVFSQSIIWQEGFENDGERTRYFSSNTFYDGANDHFRITDGSDISITGGVYSGHEGLYFWAGEDMDDVGDPDNDGSATKEVIFKEISTSGYTHLQFYGLFAAGHDGPAGSNAYDDEDSVVVSYSIDDGNSYIQVLKFASTGDQSNEPLALDSDLDGAGDSTALSAVMQEFSFSIPAADHVLIKISLSMNAGSEEIAFDDFRIEGQYDGLSSLPAAVSFALSSDTISESAGEYHLPILFENPSDSIVILMQLAGDSSKVSYFEEEVTLIAQQDSVVLARVGVADDEIINGLSKLTFSIAEISGGYESYVKEPSLFILYVLDDDFPEGGEVIISEIMYDSRSSIDDEWVELYNTTTLPINISGWYLTDDDSYPADEEGDVVIPDGTYIYPGEYLVLSWKDLTDFDGEVILDKNTGFRSYAPGLANTSDNLALYSNATGTGMLVDGSDSIFYSNASPANAGYSIERDPANGYKGDWRSAINEYGGTEIIRGTPGAVNSTHYSAISFASPAKLVSEDSSKVLVPLNIINPSNTNSTHVEVILFFGDTTEIAETLIDTITFPAGTDNLQFLEINIKDDAVIGNTDTLIYKIINVSGGLNAYITADSLFQLIIKDNDLTRVDFQMDSVEIKEGDSVGINLVITNPHPDLSTSVFLMGDIADDLLLADTEVILPPGENRKHIGLKAVFDGIVEGDEYFKLRIAAVTGGNEASVGADSAIIVKVLDNHPTTVRFLHENDTVSESVPTFNLPVVIDHPSQDSATTVEIQLIDSNSKDLTGFNKGQVIFPSDGADTAYLEIPIFNDSIREGTEQFTFELVNVSGGHYSRILEPAVFTLIMLDDEEEVYNIILNEILFDPPADSVKGDANKDGVRSSIEDEFIELVNPDSLSIDISGFTINDASGLRHIFPEGTVVAPKQGVVVFGGGSPAGGFGESIVQTAGFGRLSLNNGGDNIYLINNSDTIFSFSYSGSLGNDQSLTRSPDMSGEFVEHLSVSEHFFSPGYQVNGLMFDEELPEPYIFIDTPTFEHDFGPIYFSDTSEIRPYELRAGNLQDSLFITVPSGFEISMDGVHWITSGNLLTIYSSDSIEVEILVRFIPGASEGKIYKGEINHSTLRADTALVTVIGEGKEKPEPTITLNSTNLDFGIVTGDQQVNYMSYQIHADKLVDTLFIKAPPNFSISSDSINFFNELGFPPDDNKVVEVTIHVRLEPEAEGIYHGELVHTTAWHNEVAIALKAEFLKPVLELSVSTIDFGLVVNGDQMVKTYILSGQSLVGAVDIIAPFGIRLSVTEDFFNATNELIVTPDENREIQQKIYVDYYPRSEDILADDILHSTKGADTAKIFTEGKFIIPSIEVDPQVLDFDKYYISEEAEILSYVLSARSVVGKLKVLSPPGFELALESDFNEPVDSLVLEPDNKEIIQKIYVRFNTDSIGLFYDSIRHSTYGTNHHFVIIKGVAGKITSITDNKSHTTIRVHPIPADNFMNIEAITNSRKNIRLLNTAGREILSLKFKENIRLNTSLLDQGLYYLHISSREEVAKIKVVIVH